VVGVPANPQVRTLCCKHASLLAVSDRITGTASTRISTSTMPSKLASPAYRTRLVETTTTENNQLFVTQVVATTDLVKELYGNRYQSGFLFLNHGED